MVNIKDAIHDSLAMHTISVTMVSIKHGLHCDKYHCSSLSSLCV